MKEPLNKYDAIVIGAGISGLSYAYKLQKEGLNVLLIEKEKRFGGVIQSPRHETFQLELGPNSFALTNKTKQLIDEIGLSDKLVYANQSAKKRYIFHNGKPRLVNLKKLLLSNDLLSFKSKWKLLTERFRKAKTIHNETLGSAINRRFNKEILENLVTPIVTGIYAGDPNQLEYKSSMKRLFNFEQKSGSLTKGFIKSQKENGPRKIVSFLGGMSMLTERLSEHIEHKIQDEVLSITRTDSEHYRITTKAEKIVSKKVILATPSYITSILISDLDKKLSLNLQAIRYAKLMTFQICFKRSSVKYYLDSFGLLFTKSSRKNILGIINYSSVFGDNGEFLQFNVFASPIATNQDYKETILKELKSIYNIQGEPIYYLSKQWNNAIPQFEIGHSKIGEKCDEFEKVYPGIKFIGNWRTGVSIDDCVHF